MYFKVMIVVPGLCCCSYASEPMADQKTGPSNDLWISIYDKPTTRVQNRKRETGAFEFAAQLSAKAHISAFMNIYACVDAVTASPAHTYTKWMGGWGVGSIPDPPWTPSWGVWGHSL